MKILNLIQKKQFRGAELFALVLNGRLFDYNVESIVVSIFKSNSENQIFNEVISLNRETKYRFFDLIGWFKLFKIIKKLNVEIIQANAGDTLKYSVISKLIFRLNKPIVFRNASTISLYINSYFTLLFNRFLLKFVDHVVSVSEHTKNDFLHVFPEMVNKISVIPIGIDLSTLSTNITRSNKVLLHVGGFTFEKNHKGLLKIYSELKKKDLDLKLWLVGDGPLRNEIERVVRNNDIRDVEFFGYQTDVDYYMQQASVLILPSIIEGLPAVILEAMYCKTPVVAYNVGGINEVVINNQTGWLVEKNNEYAFVEAVQNVLKNDVKDIVQQAHSLVTKYYDNNVIAKRFVELYQEVITRK